jgi:hypothetical protein
LVQAPLKNRRVETSTITIPVANLNDWERYCAMVDENELSGQMTPAIAMENVNKGCDLIEAAFKAVGPEGTEEEFYQQIGRVVPTGTTQRFGGDHGFEQVRTAFFAGEGLGRGFLINFLPCGDMRAATIQTIVESRYGAAKASA